MAPVDWPSAEALAFGSLLLEGVPVRLSGEDSVRGTFSQRHLTWWDTQSDPPRSYTALQTLAEEQAPLHAFDSPLSEYAVLGFDYGYSLVAPDALVAWEAQFGDFANGAQVTIDNYIVSAECKWGRMSGLVLLLPHGIEGQGPDHSNAKLERFLQLAARENIQVVQPDHAGPVLPRAATTGKTPLPQAAGPHDAQEPAAPPEGHFAPERSGGGRVPGGARRHRRSGPGRAGPLVLGQGLLRPHRPAGGDGPREMSR